MKGLNFVVLLILMGSLTFGCQQEEEVEYVEEAPKEVLDEATSDEATSDEAALDEATLFAGVKEVLQMQETAWNEGNIEKYMQGYWQSDSLTFVSKTKVTRGWQATLDGYIKGYPDKATMGKLTFGVESMEAIAHDCVFVIGTWHLDREKGNVGGHFSLVWRLIKGNWVIVSDHTS